MKTPAVSRRAIRFGVYEVDLQTGELRKQGLKLRLQEKPFQILSRLLEHSGEVVTREELRQALWPADIFVDLDNSLNAAINKSREALGDSADHPVYIETLPRRGYRFIYAANGIRFGAEESTSGKEVTKRSSWARWAAAAAALAALAGLGATLFALNVFRIRDRLLGVTAAPRIQSLAVLPLANLSGDPAQEYFSDGMTDALITDLAQISSVKVISRTSSMQYKQTRKSLSEIARELNVDGIVEGTVQRSGERVRITAQLIHGPSDRHLWANSYERYVQDIFMVERDVADDIAHQVQARLTTEKQAQFGQPRPVNPKALDAYLQGNYHLNRYGRGAGDEENREAAKYFQQAIDADPDFAPAYTGLSHSHQGLMWPSKEDSDIAATAAERAADLDPNFADARVTLGNIKHHRDWDFGGAEEDYRRALALSPNNAQAHWFLGMLLLSINRRDEGLRECQVAQQLDPIGDYLGLTLYVSGQYDHAIELTRMMLRGDPDNGWLHYDLYIYYAMKGMYSEVSQEAEKIFSSMGEREGEARIHRAFVASGPRTAVRQFAAEWEHMIVTRKGYYPGLVAQTYAILGEKDRVFYWLEDAYKHHDTGWASGDIWLEGLYFDRVFDGLRTDARYRDLAQHIGLPELPPGSLSK